MGRWGHRGGWGTGLPPTPALPWGLALGAGAAPGAGDGVGARSPSHHLCTSCAGLGVGTEHGSNCAQGSAPTLGGTPGASGTHVGPPFADDGQVDVVERIDLGDGILRGRVQRYQHKLLHLCQRRGTSAPWPPRATTQGRLSPCLLVWGAETLRMNGSRLKMSWGSSYW